MIRSPTVHKLYCSSESRALEITGCLTGGFAAEQKKKRGTKVTPL